MMKHSLSRMVEFYIPNLDDKENLSNVTYSHGSMLQKLPTSETSLFKELTNFEIHENQYKIVSYGCSLNVRKDQVIWTSRLSRYNLTHPKITSLETENWENHERSRKIQQRFVSEMAKVIDVSPTRFKEVKEFSERLKAIIPLADIANDRAQQVQGDVSDEDVLNVVRRA